MSRVSTNGNRRPHVVARGYSYQSDQSARFERPAEDLSYSAGSLLVIGVFVAMLAAPTLCFFLTH